MYFLMQIRTEIKFWKPLEVGRIKFFGQKLCHRSCVFDYCVVYSFVSLGNRDWNNKKLHKNSLKKIGENKNNNKEFKTNVAHQYGTILKPAELQDIKIQKVGTVTKLSKPIKITTQNIKKKIYTTQKIQKIEGKDGQLWRRLTRIATVVFENLWAWANNFFKAHFFLFVMFDVMLDHIFVWHEAVI